MREDGKRKHPQLRSPSIFGNVLKTDEPGKFIITAINAIITAQHLTYYSEQDLSGRGRDIVDSAD